MSGHGCDTKVLDDSDIFADRWLEQYSFEVEIGIRLNPNQHAELEPCFAVKPNQTVRLHEPNLDPNVVSFV